MIGDFWTPYFRHTHHYITIINHHQPSLTIIDHQQPTWKKFDAQMLRLAAAALLSAERGCDCGVEVIRSDPTVFGAEQRCDGQHWARALALPGGFRKQNGSTMNIRSHL